MAVPAVEELEAEGADEGAALPTCGAAPQAVCALSTAQAALAINRTRSTFGMWL